MCGVRRSAQIGILGCVPHSPVLTARSVVPVPALRNPTSVGIEYIPYAIAGQIQPYDHGEDREPGYQANPGSSQEVVPPVGKDIAPARGVGG